MALLASRSKKADLVVFSEILRSKMLKENPPLIRHRRNFFKSFPNVFVASEALEWTCKTLTMSFPADSDDHSEENICNSLSSMNSTGDFISYNQAIVLFQKLLDAGILKSTASGKRIEEFQPIKSFFKFAVDDEKCDNFIKSIALGFRLYNSANNVEPSLFHRVCSLGQFVSDESLQAHEIVDWVCEHCNTDRNTAINLANHMLKNSVICPVHYAVSKFVDNSHFYIFSIDFTKNDVNISHLLNENCPHAIPQRKTTRPLPTYESLLNSDGSVTKAALEHPQAPFIKRNYKVIPDGCGYGFCVRGDGPCFVKIVDPDSPAGKAGLREYQYITSINGISVLDMKYLSVEDLIISGPRRLQISVLEKKEMLTDSVQESDRVLETPSISTSISTTTSNEATYPSPLPSPQSWLLKSSQSPYSQYRSPHVDLR